MQNLLCWLVVLLTIGPIPARASEKIVSRIGFGSCARENRPQPIWDAVRACNPDLFLLIGDNIYANTEDMAVMKRKYDQLAAIPQFAALRREVPVMGTWDDHDYGNNNVGAEYPMKAQAQQLLLDFFGVGKDDPRRKREGVYHAQVFGPEGKRVQIILLDLRYHRSPLISADGSDRPPYVPNTDPAATMLGDEQWQWLEQQLHQPAEVRLLISSIQLVAQDAGAEMWMNFPLEREKLFNLIRDTGAAGVVVLSGDRHFADLSLMDAGLGYPLYDLTSSGLTEGADRWRRLPPNRHRVAGMSWGDNFGHRHRLDARRPADQPADPGHIRRGPHQ